MAENGEVLYEREADRMLPMASTTKLMTALVVIEKCNLDDVVEILPEYCGAEGSSLYLKPGVYCSAQLRATEVCVSARYPSFV